MDRVLLWCQDTTEMVLASDLLPKSTGGVKQPKLSLLSVVRECLDGLDTLSENGFNESHRRGCSDLDSPGGFQPGP